MTDKSFTKIENANDILEEISIMPSSIETIDQAFFMWINETLNIFSTTNKGWKKVPIIWVSEERAYQIKHNKELRDSVGVLKLPLITVERTSLTKNPENKGVGWAHIPENKDVKGGAIVVAREINQVKTSNFANADAIRLKGGLSGQSVGAGQLNFPFKNKKIVYNTVTMPMPTYVVANYIIKIETEYQQQMNEIFSPFIVKTGQINNFFIRWEGHKFEGFIQNDFALENNTKNLGNEERKFITNIDIKILAYLIGDGENSDTPKITIRENAVEIKIPRERVIVGDINEFIRKDFYKE